MSLLSVRKHWAAPSGVPETADCILGFSFGTSVEPESANSTLADFCTARPNLPVIVDNHSLYSAFSVRPNQMELAADIPGSALYNRDIVKNLTIARHCMDMLGVDNPMVVAQRRLAGRIAFLAAEELGMRTIVPAGLPDVYDPASEMPYDRGRLRFTRADLFQWWVLEPIESHEECLAGATIHESPDRLF